jgi:hypothetical protein
MLFINKNDRRVTQSDFLLYGDTALGTFYLEDKSEHTLN